MEVPDQLAFHQPKDHGGHGQKGHGGHKQKARGGPGQKARGGRGQTDLARGVLIQQKHLVASAIVHSSLAVTATASEQVTFVTVIMIVEIGQMKPQIIIVHDHNRPELLGDLGGRNLPEPPGDLGGHNQPMLRGDLGDRNRLKVHRGDI